MRTLLGLRGRHRRVPVHRLVAQTQRVVRLGQHLGRQRLLLIARMLPGGWPSARSRSATSSWVTAVTTVARTSRSSSSAWASVAERRLKADGSAPQPTTLSSSPGTKGRQRPDTTGSDTQHAPRTYGGAVSRHARQHVHRPSGPERQRATRQRRCGCGAGETERPGRTAPPTAARVPQPRCAGQVTCDGGVAARRLRRAVPGPRRGPRSARPAG